jgi:BirA family biotin operon repressor/biotin-[acetyl-CoA-carboxylase] ligase
MDSARAEIEQDQTKADLVIGGCFYAPVEYKNFIPRPVGHYETTYSTQNVLFRVLGDGCALSEDAKPLVRMVSADHQTAGRGKGKRSWFSSPECSCLALSIMIPFPCAKLNRAALVTQLLALSAVETIECFVGKVGSPAIKWPNDILLDGRKVGGILAEVHPGDSDFQVMIIGIGLNIDIPDDVLAEGIQREGRWPPGSISRIAQTPIDKTLFRDKLIETFLTELGRFFEHEFPDRHLLSTLSSKQYLLGQSITFNSGDRTVEGTHAGISDTGCIVIESIYDGKQIFSSGEIVASS